MSVIPVPEAVKTAANLAVFLRQRRKQIFESMLKYSEVVGIPVKTLEKHENLNALHLPRSLENIKKIAKALKIDPESLAARISQIKESRKEKVQPEVGLDGITETEIVNMIELVQDQEMEESIPDEVFYNRLVQELQDFTEVDASGKNHRTS